jgi:hypothetical protein
MPLETPLLPVDEITARLRAVTCEIPNGWKFCTISPIYLFPYQVNEIGALLLADAKYNEKTQTLRIENIGDIYNRERLIAFLMEIRARDENIKVAWEI